MPVYGIIHLLSLIFLTGVVALVIGLQEVEEPAKARKHVLGCWARLLGSLVGLGLIVFILNLLGR